MILCFFIPFLGTVLGAATVFFVKGKLNQKFEQTLIGFAGGMMIAASVWSLLLPAIDQSANLGKMAWLPAAIGFAVGILFLFLVEIVSAKLMNKSKNEEPFRRKNSSMLLLAIAIHNIPEGMAVGVALAGAYYAVPSITLAAALTLAIGISIQNFPDGAMVSLPLYVDGVKKGKAFWLGVASGVLELISGIVAFFLTELFASILPYMLAFAAGATMFVVIKDLIPNSQNGEHSDLATIAFSLGFIIMMILDIALA